MSYAAINTNELYTKYNKLVYREAWRLYNKLNRYFYCPPPEDIAQDGWVNILQHLHLCDPNKSVSNYIVLVMRTSIMSLITRRINKLNKLHKIQIINSSSETSDDISDINMSEEQKLKSLYDQQFIMIEDQLKSLTKLERNIVMELSGFTGKPYTKQELGKKYFPKHKRGRDKIRRIIENVKISHFGYINNKENND